MQARIVAVGAVRGVEELTYSVPPELEGCIAPGHRVLAPLRSRKVTGVVLETGENLCGAGEHRLKPILELLEPRPLFDRAHLRMMEFLASYYMVPRADVYRSVIPAVARIESRIVHRLARDPDALRRAAFSDLERKVVEALTKRAMNSRQLSRLGAARELSAALSELTAEGIVETVDSTRGRHRDNTPMLARFAEGADLSAVRGSKQRQIADAIGAAGGTLALDVLEERVPGAKLALRALEKRGIVSLEPIAAEPSQNGAARPSLPFKLSAEQEEALAAIAPAIEQRKFAPFLLFGVTGSGKTEVYLHLAERTLKAGRSVVVMVPEIALAGEIVRSFRARFGAQVGIAHSAQNVAERWASWKSALSGQARIMIGPRSLVFAPIHDPGLIVVDEEHDPSYKNEEGIRYHARDLAVVLARMAGCPVVLGSATPSAESFANARRGRYRLLRLPRRAGDRAMASVEVIDL